MTSNKAALIAVAATLAAATLGLAGHAAAQETRVLKLSPDGSNAEARPLRDITYPNKKIKGASYFRDPAGGSVGFSFSDGPQYIITTPRSAEVLHVLTGETTYVGAKGEMFKIRPNDVLFIMPDLPTTGRDGYGYRHHYVVFPFTPPAGAEIPQMVHLRPSELKASDYKPGPTGQEHAYFEGQNGSKVSACKFNGEGQMPATTQNLWLAVVDGQATFREGGVTTAAKKGENLLVKRGAQLSWQAKNLSTVCVWF
ncbi:hypothetical protein [Phenylobacterium sp.]|jgi:uncharacterized cupin superfamily protein|uniref:hypothetical protein n=1 Tax=Phenylobacterium sp. TaxID=1871053 RepID=UPI00378435DC